MTNKNKPKQKGVAHVEGDDIALRTTNIINMEEAGVRHAGDGGLCWNDLEAMGPSDNSEREYRNQTNEAVDLRKDLRNTHVGRMLLRLSRQEMAA